MQKTDAENNFQQFVKLNFMKNSNPNNLFDRNSYNQVGFDFYNQNSCNEFLYNSPKPNTSYANVSLKDKLNDGRNLQNDLKSFLKFSLRWAIHFLLLCNVPTTDLKRIVGSSWKELLCFFIIRTFRYAPWSELIKGTLTIIFHFPYFKYLNVFNVFKKLFIETPSLYKLITKTIELGISEQELLCMLALVLFRPGFYISFIIIAIDSWNENPYHHHKLFHMIYNT